MSQFPLGTQFALPPNVATVIESVENQFWFQDVLNNIRLPAKIDGSTRDTGNTGNTKVLRQGLALGGPIESGGDQYKLKHWDPTATDGSQFFYGFLMYQLTMFDALGNDQDRYVDVMVAGNVYSDYVIIPGNTALGLSGTYANALPYTAQGRFLFDKNIKAGLPKMSLPPIALGASPITLTAADSGRTYTNAGAVGSKTVVPPDPLAGLIFTFIDVAGQNIVITPALTDCICGPGNLLADTITITTGTQAGNLVTIQGVSSTLYIVTQATGSGVVLTG